MYRNKKIAVTSHIDIDDIETKQVGPNWKLVADET